MKFLLSLLFIFAATYAQAQATFTAKDASGSVQTFKSFNCSGNICSLSVPADITGAAFGVTSNPFFVTNNGTFAVQAIQSGTWNVTNAGTFAVQATQAGTWNIGSITTLPSITGTVTANAGTNLNTSLLALESGGNLASLVAQIGAVTASPTANTVNDRLKIINTTLGNPFQAGGSIGNTSFGISGTLPAFSSTPTFNLGTLNGAATASNQTNASQKTQIVDGSGNVIAATSNALNVNCTGGCSGGGGTSSNFSATFPIAGTAVGMSNGTNMVPFLADGSGNLKTVVSAALPAGSNAIGSITNTTFAATQSGTWNINDISGTISLPNGAATSAKQPSLGTAGLPSSDVISVQGVVSGTEIPVSAASLPLPTLASTSTKQSDGSQKTQIVDGSGNVIGATSNALDVNIKSGGGSGGTSSNFGATLPAAGTAAGMSQGGNMVALTGTSGNLNVQCANCSGSGASAADASTFTAGSSTFAPGGGFYQTTATSNALTDGQWGTWQMTANRAGFVNLRTAAGAETGIAGLPLQVSLANTATNSTAVKVDGSAVTQPVSGSVTSNVGTGTRAVSIASGQVVSGAFASGSIASGAIAAGAQVDFLTTRQTVAAGTVAANSQLVGGIYNSTPITMSNGQGAALQFDANGYLKVNTAAGGSGGTSSNFGSTFPTAGTAIGLTNGSNMVAANADGSGNLKVNLATALPTGANAIGSITNTTFAATQSGTWNVGVSAGSNLIGKVGIDQTTPGTTNATSLAQIGSTTILAGNGATGNGSQRVTIANDNSPVSGLGVGATGSAPPANGNYIATRQTGNLAGLISCDNTATYDASTSGSTQLVALTSSQTVYVCGYSIGVGASATNVKLVYGTGTNCATSPSDITPAYQLAANGGVVDKSPFWSGLKTAASNALCVNASGANPVQVIVYYTKF